MEFVARNDLACIPAHGKYCMTDITRTNLMLALQLRFWT